MNRWDVSRLPTPFEAGNMADFFDRLARADADPGWKLRYAVSRNAMQALSRGRLVQPTGPDEAGDLLAKADELMRQVASGELKGKDAASRWEQLRQAKEAA